MGAVDQDGGAAWAAGHMEVRPGDAAFATSVHPGALRAHLGWVPDTSSLGAPVLGLDPARTVLTQCRAAAPGAFLVQADPEALPLRRAAIHGAWAAAYGHVPRVRLPLALGDLHRSLAVGAQVDLQVPAGDEEACNPPTDRKDPRSPVGWQPAQLAAVLTGAGFDVRAVHLRADVVVAVAERARTLADTVAPGMRLLVCGLNPSVYAADVGAGFARPGNRFWPAAIAAGLASRPRDPLHALVHHGTGMTDLVKRATVGAAELTAAEYEAGVRRVEGLCRWLRPGGVCFVGLAGWRSAVDRRAVPGVQPELFGGVPAYLMPSSSGRNAHSRPADLAEHLRAAAALAGR